MTHPKAKAAIATIAGSIIAAIAIVWANGMYGVALMMIAVTLMAGLFFIMLAGLR